MAFDGAVTYLLCRVYCERSINRRFPGDGDVYSAVRRHLFAALFLRRSAAGCHESLRAAVDAATKEEDKRYIRRNWVATAADWANFARCGHPLLQQMRSTNMVEAWHRALKHRFKAAMRQ